MKYSKNLEAKLQEKVGEPRKEELQQPEEAEPSSPRLLSDKDPRKTGVFQKTPEEECPSKIEDIGEPMMWLQISTKEGSLIQSKPMHLPWKI